MTSLEIAKLTGKRHADVMRDIRNMLSNLEAQRNYALSDYIVVEQPDNSIISKYFICMKLHSCHIR